MHTKPTQQQLSYGVRHQQPPGRFRGLTVYLQWLIAGDEMPLGVDQHRKLCQPSATFKPPRWVTHALNGTLPVPFILLQKFIRCYMHVSRLPI